MKIFTEKEVFEMFDSLFRFDDYENGYVTSGMAKKLLQEKGIIKSLEKGGGEDSAKKFNLINHKLPI